MIAGIGASAPGEVDGRSMDLSDSVASVMGSGTRVLSIAEGFSAAG